MDQPSQQWSHDPRCRCGRAITRGARSCRACYRAGRGAKVGRRGPSLAAILKHVREMKPNKNGEVHAFGLTFKRVTHGTK
jgi:hypothetical protein